MAATLSTIYNNALSQIKSQCMNISQYDSISSMMKSGATKTITSKVTSGNYRSTTTLKWTISNPISRIAEATVDSDFEKLMASYGVTATNSVPTAGKLFQFYCALAIFCQARVKIAASPLVDTKYVIYDRSSSYGTITPLVDNNVATAKDIATITTNIMKIVCANTKGYQVKYSESVTVSV